MGKDRLAAVSRAPKEVPMKRSVMTAVTAFLWLLVHPQGTQAQVPQIMSYQGVLTDSGDGPVPNGNYNFSFRIYSVSTGGSALWTEAQSNVPVTRGTFSVLLGSSASLTLPFDVQYW